MALNFPPDLIMSCSASGDTQTRKNPFWPGVEAHALTGNVTDSKGHTTPRRGLNYGKHTKHFFWHPTYFRKQTGSPFPPSCSPAFILIASIRIQRRKLLTEPKIDKRSTKQQRKESLWRYSSSKRAMASCNEWPHGKGQLWLLGVRQARSTAAKVLMTG